MAPDSEETTPEVDPADHGQEEAQKGKAEVSWEEGYQALYNARENLLQAICKVQRFVSEEVGPGVIGEGHVRASLAQVLQEVQAGFKEVNEAWRHFRLYYAWKADTLPPSPGTWPPEADKPISLYPAEPVSEGESGEASPGNPRGQAD